jgi:hypothetical protein
MALSRYLLLAVAALVASAAGFFGMNWVLDQRAGGQTGSRAPVIRATPVHAARLASDVSECVNREIAAGQNGAQAKCGDLARNLFLTIQQVPKNFFEFYKGESKFEVIRTGKHVTVFRPNCRDSDLTVKTFAWGIQTATPQRPAAGGEPTTNFSGTQSFDATGFRVEGACLLVLEVTFPNPKALSVGQWDPATGTYSWAM